MKELGVDEVYCLSVNDAFTMFQWGKHQNVQNVKLLPDGNGDFTRGMGMLVKKTNLGFGDRSWRYSMLVEDGAIKKLFVEPGFSDDCPTDPFEVSDAHTMLEHLRSEQNIKTGPRPCFYIPLSLLNRSSTFFQFTVVSQFWM